MTDLKLALAVLVAGFALWQACDRFTKALRAMST